MARSPETTGNSVAMRIFIRGFVAFAVMMTALLAIAAPARAEGCLDDCWTAMTIASAPYTYRAGDAFFESNGEWMHVGDHHKDGAGVRVHFSVNYGAWHERTNTSGAPSQTHYNFDYAENLSFRFFVCISNNGANLASTCSKMIYAHT
jgi:hypothetical protein